MNDINSLIADAYAHNSKYHDFGSNRRVFTFWHDKNEIPGYIKLCLATWQKHLPEYEIIILDYALLEEYFPVHLISRAFFSFFQIHQQTDFLRVFLLQHYGGYWLDADTVITGPCSFFEAKADGLLYAYGKASGCYTGMLCANKSPLLDVICTEVGKRYDLFLHVVEAYHLMSTVSVPLKRDDHLFSFLNEAMIWDYFSNAVFDPLLLRFADSYRPTCPFSTGTILEKSPFFALGQGLSDTERYLACYFTEKFDFSLLDNCEGLIALHNSWTPPNFKAMSARQFLRQPIGLAQLLKAVG